MTEQTGTGPAYPLARPGAPLRHPAWCDPGRCTAAPNLPFGVHRSAPVPANPAGNEIIHFAAHLEMFGDEPGQEPRTPDEAWLVLTVTAPDPEVREESGLPLTFLVDRVQAGALAGVLDGLVQATAPDPE